MAESFPAMNGGDGAFSYTKNSLLQLLGLEFKTFRCLSMQEEGSDYVKAMIHEEIIKKLDPDVSAVIRLADFGCSVGPNTFSALQNMIDAAEKKAGPEAEFEVFFNDKTSNDFNTLFASLPRSRKYYAAAVPGSFHDRLFLRASIALAHSAFTLHLLSKLPAKIADRESRAWNGGRIHYTCGGEAEKAYSDQFGRDMEVFLRCRAEEIVKGGLMFLTIPAQGSYSIIINHFESTILDLLHEGVMKEGAIDCFDLPIYYPREEEVRKAIEENGCFSIERVELTNPKTRLSARAIAIHFRAILEGMFRQGFGDSLIERIFAKSLAKAEDKENSPLLEAALYDSVQLFYVLKRK